MSDNKLSDNLLIEQILEEFSVHLLNDFAKYRNHVYRVFYLCTTIDADPKNKNKYAIASAFHDLGIWTNATFDYLEPSISLARKWLSEQGDIDRSDEITRMIDMHHKVSRYSGEYSQTVETFRKADWIDVSLGLIKFGVRKETVHLIGKNYPKRGFHRFLAKKVLKNLIIHPENPLPMFKK